MESSAPLRVQDDQGNRPNSPASVQGGQASHALLVNEPEQVTGGAIDIFQQLVQTLQRAAQPATVTPQRSSIERMARYRPVDFYGTERG